MPDPAADLTSLLRAWNQGEPGAFDRVAPLVFGEMRKIARGHLSRDPSATIQPTELVQETYIKLMAQRQPSWADRRYFYGVVAKMMRRLLMDLARERHARKHGGDLLRITLSDSNVPTSSIDVEVLALNEALDALEHRDVRLAETVELRYFGGFSVEETSEILNVSEATVKRDWAYAKAWLSRRLKANGTD